MAKQNPVKLTIQSDITYRVAQIPMHASIEEAWHALKESIRLSSPAFYAEVKDLDAHDL